MTGGPVLLALLTLVGLLGAALVVLPTAEAARPTAAGRRVDGRALAPVGGGVAVAGLVVVTSGWVLPALAAGVGMWWVLGQRGDRARDRAERIARVEAIAAWIENLRDVLIAGEQPVGAIGSTVGTCPAAIRPSVRRLAVSLGRQDPEVAVRRFADDIDDPIGDLVAAGLLIAVRRGARTVPVLSALAEQARAQADRRRLVEAERAPTRREVSALVLIMSALLGGLLVLGRSSYLDAYDTLEGQLFLAGALLLYGALLLRVRQLARFPQPGRFLSVGGGS